MTYSEIQNALKTLPPAQLRQMGMWIYLLADEAFDRVAETALKYELPEAGLMSFEEYMELYELSDLRLEYVAGEVFAMCGVSRKHAVICRNLSGAVHAHLKGKPCQLFPPDFKVRLKYASKDHSYYPDLTVACGEKGLEEYWLTHPKLVIEVLSPSTEGIDRRQKAPVYRAAPTVEEFLLIAQEEPHITIQRRADNWRSSYHFELSDVVELRSIDLKLSLAQIYEGAFTLKDP
jgi:Uma2 family endonuclease